MIDYTATVIAKSEQSIEVLFEAPGYEPVTVGVLAPLQGEDFDAMVQAAAPIAHWEFEERKKQPKQNITVGKKIKAPKPVAPAPTEPATQPVAKLGETVVVL